MNGTRWGILGAGAMAEMFAQALQSVPDAKVQAVAARSKDRADRFAAQFGIPVSIEGYDRFFQEAAVDVVYISTPNEYHSEHCLQAMAAGKAVLCEKPFALTAQEGAEVVKQARESGIFCMEAMWMRFAPALREAMSLAKEGKLGELTYFAGELGFPYLTDPASRLFRKPGGGVLLDLGVYPLSFAQALLGKPEKIVSSAALGPTGVDEQFAAILSYKEGAQAVIAASLRAQLRNSAAIHGRNGVLNVGEPLYFPESYRLMGTPAHSLEKKSVGKLAKLRRYPLVRTLADLRNRSRARTVSKHSSQSGYCFEALEVQRCLKAGLLESPGMPLNDTLAVLELMDSIRAEWSR